MFSGVFGIGFFMLRAVTRSLGGTRGSIGFLSSANAIAPILEHTNTATSPARERCSIIRLTRMEGLRSLLPALEASFVENHVPGLALCNHAPDHRHHPGPRTPVLDHPEQLTICAITIK